ncbi:MAG: LamB/YcsF family protein [Streptosporangiaceae bacterium]
MTKIDINADLGEGFGVWRLGDDTALLDVITSANIACGFHAGDPLIMRRTCAAAVERGVAIGAQVSYRDLPGFGRRPMDMPADTLAADVLYQLAALDGVARAEGGAVRYVKPHGALYNRIVGDEEQAAAVVEAVRAYDPSLPVLTLARSVVHDAATRERVRTIRECFADRAYTSEGTLVSRRQAGAVIHDETEVTARVVRMATEGVVRSVDGDDVRVDARSVCVHGDTPGAVELAKAVRRGLMEAGVRTESFA